MPQICALFGATVPWPGCKGNWLPSTLAAQMLRRLVGDPLVRPFQTSFAMNGAVVLYFFFVFCRVYKDSRLPSMHKSMELNPILDSVIVDYL